MNKSLLTLLTKIGLPLFLNTQRVYAQNQQKIDSLLICLEEETVDTLKVNILNELGLEFTKTKPEKAKIYAKQALSLGMKCVYKKGIAFSYKIIGYTNILKGNYSEALEYHLKSLKIYKEINNKSGISNILSFIGT